MSATSSQEALPPPTFDGWRTSPTEKVGNTFLWRLSPCEHPSHCPHCGAEGPFAPRGKKPPRVLAHVPLDGGQTALHFQRPRYFCRSCQSHFLHPLPFDSGPDEKSVWTAHGTPALRTYILDQSLSRSYVAIAAAIGWQEKTIRNVVKAHHESADNRANGMLVIPTTLGIEVAEVQAKLRWLLTNVEKRTVLDILSDDRPMTLITRLHALPKREKITHVYVSTHAMHYRTMLRPALPCASLILNPSNALGGLLRMALDAVEAVIIAGRDEGAPEVQNLANHAIHVVLLAGDWLGLRVREKRGNSALRSAISLYLQHIPRLSIASDLLIRFFINRGTTVADVERAYQVWLEKATAAALPEFDDLTKALRTWYPEFAASFFRSRPDYYICLARVQNFLFQQPDTISFNVMRYKVLHGSGCRKVDAKHADRDFGVDMERLCPVPSPGDDACARPYPSV